MARTRAAKSTAWAGLGQLAGVLVSLANFLLLARLLGPADYGLVAGAWALVLAVGPVMTLGAERLVIRDFTSHGDARAALGAGLVTSSTGATTGVLLLTALHPVLLPQVPILLLASLAVAEILAGGLTACLITLSFAAGDARGATVSTILIAVAKLSAVLVFALGGGDDPVRWAVAYAVLSLGAALGQVLWGCFKYGRPRLVDYKLGRRVKEGLPYSIGNTAGVAHTSADKILLVRFGFVEEAGLYAVASRLASVASMPVLSVMHVMLPRYFAAGASGGLAASAAFGRRLTPLMTAYGVFAGLALAVGAVLLPNVLGDEYARAAPILLLLAPLPLVRLLTAVTGDALTGAGRQGTRTRCVVISAVANVALNLVLIPEYGLTGALVTLLVTQVLSLVQLRLALRRCLRQDVSEHVAA